MLIKDNPFYILGASLHDGRQDILELAEEKSLFEEEEKCIKSSSDLINPRNRLDAELSWVVSHLDFDSIKSAFEHAVSAKDTLFRVSTLVHFDNLGKANLLVSAMVDKASSLSNGELTDWILEIADYYERVNSEDVANKLNDLRKGSGFPLISDVEMVSVGVQGRGKFFKNTLITILDALESSDIVECMTMVADSATNYGKIQPPKLIHDLVDAYEIEAQVFLDSEMENASYLIDEIAEKASSGDGLSTLNERVEKLIEVIQNWDSVAQPIQISCKSRGVRHKKSYEIFGNARSLAITLFNDHNHLELAKKITKTLQVAFEELDVAVEKASEDITALNEIEESRKFDLIIEEFNSLSKSVFEKIDENPSVAKSVSEKFVIKTEKIIAVLFREGAGTEVVDRVKDDASFVLVQCAIAFGNHTSKWIDCKVILEKAKKYAVSKKGIADANKNLEIAKNNSDLYHGVEPVDSAPTLRSINGIGFTLYGNTDHDPKSGSYVSTYYFIVFGIPLLPIARYKVVPFDRGYRFLGKVPLRPLDKIHIAAFIGVVAWIFILNN
jgi:hypothetical protein